MAGAKHVCYHAHPASPTPLGRCKHPRTVVGVGDGVLVVGGSGVVGGVDRPTVPFADANVVIPERYHRLYGEGHTGQEAWSGVRSPVVGNLGILVHLAPHAVRDEVPYYPVSPRFSQGLYRVADVSEPFADPNLVGGRRQTLPCRVQEALDLLRNPPNRDGRSRVGHEALVANAHIQGDNVAVLEPVRARDAVYDHGVGRSTDGARKGRVALLARVALELGRTTVRAYKVLGHPVELSGRDPDLNVLREHPKAGGRDPAALTHHLKLAPALADNQKLLVLPDGLEHLLRHLVDLPAGVDGDEYALLLVVVLQGLGLLVIGLQAIADGLLGIIVTLDKRARILLAALLRWRIMLDVVDLARRLALPAAREPLDELLVRRLEYYDFIDLLIDLLKSLIERLGLLLIAREAVQDPGIVLVEVGLRHVDDDLIGDEFALVAVLFYLLPELGLLLDLAAHKVAGLDMRGAGLLFQLRRLGALAGALRTHQYHPHRCCLLPFKNPS